MDTSLHNPQTLFRQLGLSDRPQDIVRFIAEHRLSTAAQPLAAAPFWSPAQAAFIQEAIEQDSDWCEVVDELDRMLRG
jgi:hypothetical protein